VTKSAADGYTLLSADNGQLAITPYLFKTLPYDTLRDLMPISIVCITPLIFVSSAKSQIKSIKDLVREAKANPGKVYFGRAGRRPDRTTDPLPLPWETN